IDFFSQQTDAELHRHIHSNGEIKQQQLHSTATKQHKRLVKEETLLKLCDEIRPNLILTTGGTRLNPDDITPETSTSLMEGQYFRDGRVRVMTRTQEFSSDDSTV
ncbi:unnamed protein product, partial [Rotaria magnacalcarata]